jgi:ParB family chromosome partitioning protein
MSKQLSRPRLGRGLNALLSLNHDESNTPMGSQSSPANSTLPGGNQDGQAAQPIMLQTPTPSPYQVLRLDDIAPNPHQPRKQMDESALADLAGSLKTTGLIQPIIVRAVAEGYELIAGERRFRAARLAGFTDIPAIIRSADSYSQAQMALVENIHRADLNPIERAVAYQELMTQLGLTQAELATRLGEQRSSIANYLRLLELTDPIRDLVRDGKLSLGHAKILAGVSDPVEQQRLAELCVSQDLSVRNLERLLETPSTATKVRTEPEAPSAHLRDLETNLSRQLGLRVQVRSGARKGRGRVVIHYTSLDQFDDLVRRLGVELESL